MSALFPDPIPESPFEKTYRLVCRLDDSEIDYVKDTGEWIARCVSRVLNLDPLVAATEVTPLVVDMSTRGRWRLMRPETVADQIALARPGAAATMAGRAAGEPAGPDSAQPKASA